MSSRMNFDDTINDKFMFTVGGKDFDLIYPTLDQMTSIQQEIKEIQSSKKSQQQKEIEINLALVESVRKFVVPVGHNEDFNEVLSKQPVNVTRALNTKLVELVYQGE